MRNRDEHHEPGMLIAVEHFVVHKRLVWLAMPSHGDDRVSNDHSFHALVCMIAGLDMSRDQTQCSPDQMRVTQQAIRLPFVLEIICVT